MEDPCMVVPLTSSRPKGPSRSFAVELSEKVGSLDPTLYIRCDCPTTIAGTRLPRDSRAALRGGIMEKVVARIGALIGVSPI